jgi:hypothetical protein
LGLKKPSFVSYSIWVFKTQLSRTKVKTLFEEIKTKPDLENKINSNIDHRHSPLFLFYFKVPSRGLICKARKLGVKITLQGESEKIGPMMENANY